jgi:hypothetical protein
MEYHSFFHCAEAERIGARIEQRQQGEGERVDGRGLDSASLLAEERLEAAAERRRAA